MNRSAYRTVVALGAIAILCAWSSRARAGNNQPYNPSIDPADFVAVIDNPYFPLIPGTTYVYFGDTEDGPDVDIVAVTTNTAEILGVTCTAVQDTESVNGEVEEDTTDWYAQDNKGNVWYFGEFSTQYENGEVVGHEGSWTGGVDGALPGIIMLADPEPGVMYRQEYQEDVAEDWGQVLRLNAKVSTSELGDFDDCLMTREWSPLENGAIEQKFYAKNVGVVLVNELHGKNFRQELIDVITTP